MTKDLRGETDTAESEGMDTNIGSEYNACMHRGYCRQLEGALRELLECKALKESLPGLAKDLKAWGLANAEYQRRKPLAWAQARKVMRPN